MAGRDSFSGLHPIVCFAYFALVLFFTMFLMHPALLALSLLCAAAYSVRLSGRKALRLQLAVLLPVFIMTLLISAAFNHEGATVLAYLPTGNPLTLESILYGLSSAVMLSAVITWFSCYSAVMTSDKFVYLFGRVIPALSLVLSMTLRFVPKFKAQLHTVSQAQKCVGRDASCGPALQRVRHAAAIVSIMVTWALENAIETSDSMKSRGYGLPGRTAFSIYRFDARDRAVLAWLLACGFYTACGWAAGGLYWRFYPTVKGAALTPLTLSFHLAYTALCLTPLILDRREERFWKRSKSET